MSAEVSENWSLAASSGGVRPITTVTATPFGADPIELSVDACQVTKSLDSGARFQASIAVVREPGMSTWELTTAPGTIFAIDHGWYYGPGADETIPLGRYELASQPKSSRSETVSLALMDQWKRLEECRLLAPVTAPMSTNRISFAQAQVLAAIPAATFRNLATSGGTVGTATTWDRERTQLLNNLSRDGGFGAYFAADGVFEFSDAPSLSETPVATFVDGQNANILDLSTELEFTRQYNAVRVVPSESQSWSAVTVQIQDTSHPRHASRIGLRPYFLSVPTIGSSAAARVAGEAVLKRIINALERIEINTWAAGHLEPGDTIATEQGSTWTDAALSGSWLVENVTHNCLTLETTITARSTADVPVEEEG